MDDVLAIIPEPKKEGRQYKVDNAIWHHIIETFKFSH
jgi:hypothetical protein